MLKRFLPIFTLLAMAATIAAQIPEPIAPVRNTVQSRSPLACSGGANAGTTTRILGTTAKSNEKHYLCIGDTLYVNGSGANLLEDPIAATTPGIGYLFYDCMPTISGPRWGDIRNGGDPCLTRRTSSGNNANGYVSRGNVLGRDTFFNNGALQASFNNGKPVKFYFAPATLYDFFGQGNNGIAGFDNDTACVNVNITNGIPNDTFSVVYLNAVKISNLNLVSNGGSFTVGGGLPEYDGVSNYTFTIALQSNPSVNVGTITSGPATNGSLVNFTVPGNGVYIITARDGKACDAQVTANFPVVTVNISDEAANQNDTVCVRISARNFTNIISWECNYQYNPSVLEFVGLRSLNLPNLSNTPNVNYNVLPNGIIVFSWNVSSATGVTRTDNETLYEMCFKAIGSSGSSSTVCMTDTLNPIDIYNASNNKLGVNKPCGTVRIGNAMTIQLSNETVAQGDTACVTVSAKNFTNIVSMEGNFQFNPALVEFVGIRGINLPGLSSAPNVNYSVPAPGVLAFSWNVNSGSVTRPDGVGLFQLCFKAIGPNGTIVPIRFTDTLNPIDIYNSSNIKMGVTRVNGSITIGAATFTIRVSADSVRCNGTSTGKFKIVPTGAGAPWTYSWQNATNPGQNGTGTIAQGDSAIVTNLPVGKYYISVTNTAGGGLRRDSVTIFQPNPLFINPPTARNPTCANDTDGSLTLTNFGGGVSPYTFRWSTGATTTAITNLASGAYTCTVTDFYGCKDSVRASIGVNAITIGTRNITGAICKGVDNGSIVISGISGGTPSNGNYTFRWSNSRTNVGTSSTISNLAPGTYRVTITDLNQCSKIDSFVVSSQRTISAVATIGNITCAGQTNGFIQVVASAIGLEAQPYTFTWWGNPGTPTNTAATSFLRSLSAGTYPLSIRDNDGCSLDTSFVVSQPDSIKIVASIQNESCRVGNDGRISLTITGGRPSTGNRYNIQWSRGNAGDTTPIIASLSAGTYSVTVSDSTNCTLIRTFTVTKPQPPTIDSISVRDATCSDKSDGAARAFARAPAGATIDSFRWSNTGFRDSINNVLPGIYSVTVTTNQGCTATLTDTVYAPAPLAIDTARSRNTSPDCPKNATGTIILVMKGGTAPYTYTWSGGPATSNSVFPSLAEGVYSFTITDSKGCTPVVHNVSLSDPPKIEATFGSLEPVSCNGKCNPGDGKATAIASGGTANTGKYTFIWASGETSNNSNTSSAVNLCGGWQQVTITDGNCAIIDSVEIPQPLAFSFFTPIINQPSCNGDRDGSAEIRVQGGTPPYNFFWSNGSNRSSIVNVPSGTYSVLITDANLCSYNYSVNITQPDVVKLDTVASLTNNVTCYGLADGQIKVKRTGGNGGPTNYIWSPTVSQTDSAGGLKSGTYSIVAYDVKGCGDSIQFSISQPDPIYYYMTPPTQPRCNGELTTLRVDTAFGSTYLHSFSVSVDNGPQYPIGYFIPVFAGQHQISIIEQITGCTLDTSVIVSEPPPLLIQFDSLTKPNEIAKILVGLGDSVRMLSDPRFFSRSRIISALPIDSVSWTPKDYLYFANGDSLRPYVRPLDDRTYKLTIFDVNGCSTSEFILVELDRNRNVFIPNIFSPNGDDRNDYFGIATGPGVKKINYIRIYDRWGEPLFRKENIPAGADPVANGWDGTFRGRTVDSGVYVYLVEVEFEDGQKLLYRGDVTIVK
ncbi:MAG: gliding motility-associated C-terminal domain-containing protein [Saprospiraceae bacterium]|nr:gliding motility-associated C-terminal domain-containing protein [Saprospiraceae bacterium]